MHIYKVTNLTNGKIYIGQTISKFTKTYLGSGTKILLAVKKYGRKNFKKELLEQCFNVDDLNVKERYWIEHYNSTDDSIGYNICSGGQQGGTGWSKGLTKETHSGLQIMSQKASDRTGWTHSEETKLKQSESAAGRYSLSWFIDKFGQEIGTQKFQDRNKEISIRMKGNIPWNKGIPHNVLALHPELKDTLEEKYYSKIRGKTLAERHGVEEAARIIQIVREKNTGRKKPHTSTMKQIFEEKIYAPRRGKSMHEFYGEERATNILTKRIETRRRNRHIKKIQLLVGIVNSLFLGMCNSI